jgi:hypothetical protein
MEAIGWASRSGRFIPVEMIPVPQQYKAEWHLEQIWPGG